MIKINHQREKFSINPDFAMINGDFFHKDNIKFHLSIISIIIIFSYFAYIALRKTPIEGIIIYYDSVPNRYRLQSQITLLLHDIFFSYQLWSALIFCSIMIIAYFLLKPRGIDLIIFLGFIGILSKLPMIENGLMYLLLILMVKYNKRFLILSLAIIKEFSIWQAIGYYLIYQKNRMLTIIYGITAFLIYFIIIMLLGWTTYLGVDYFEVYQKLIPNFANSLISNLHYIIPIILFSVLMVNNRNDVFLLIWNIPFILFFGNIWEAQLWFPIFFLITANKMYIKENKNREVLN